MPEPRGQVRRLRHQQHQRKPLGDSTEEVLKHLHRLWGFDLHLESRQGEQLISTLHVPAHNNTEGDEQPRLDLAMPFI